MKKDGRPKPEERDGKYEARSWKVGSWLVLNFPSFSSKEGSVKDCVRERGGLELLMCRDSIRTKSEKGTNSIYPRLTARLDESFGQGRAGNIQ